MPHKNNGKLSRVKMKNLRISSLDADRPVAEKDCQVCCRRRIRCDRTLPSCKKCEFRGLTCSGYAQRLRWNHGLASRGKLAGKTYRSSSSDGETGARQGSETSPSPSELEPPLGQASSSSSDPTGLLPDPSSDTNLALETYHFQRLHLDEQLRRTESPQSPQPQVWPTENTSNSELATLMQHFDQNIAGLLTWVDSTENQWRRIILPLASNSPSLYFAIASLSAVHVASTSSDLEHTLPHASQLAVRYRDASLKSLNQQLRDELKVSNKSAAKDVSKTYPLLATMLVLCHLEMLPRNSEVWKIHLRACRSTIRNITSSLSHPDEFDDILKFLIKEVHDLEVYTSVSTFSPDTGQALQQPMTGPPMPTVHWPFTNIIRDITNMERMHHNILSRGGTVPDVNTDFWQGRLTEASIKTGNSFQTSYQGTNDAHDHLTSIIEVHNLACTIYFFQTLADVAGHYTSTAQKIADALLDTLFLLSIDVDHVSGHVYIWPLFIAGTECRANQERQRFVQDFLLREIAKTGFGCNYRALDFLQSFWTADSQHHSTWIQYKRATLGEADSFMLY